jgi:hypothetical protein
MKYEYRVVPFAGVTKQKDRRPGATLANQLAGLIQEVAAEGWEFYRVDHVSINIRGGCLFGLFSAQVATQTYDMVIFRRPSSG